MKASRILFPCDNKQADENGKCVRVSYGCDECPYYESRVLSRIGSALRTYPRFLPYFGGLEKKSSPDFLSC
jgi:hypothetical protein